MWKKLVIMQPQEMEIVRAWHGARWDRAVKALQRAQKTLDAVREDAVMFENRLQDAGEVFIPLDMKV